MNETADRFRRFIQLALEHPEGPEVARAFDRTFQFDLTDAEPFYLELKGGNVRVAEGDCGLDWKVRDWERVTCVRTSARVLDEIVEGWRIMSEAFFDAEIGFAPRRLADRNTDATAMVAWFYTLFRLAHERAQQTAVQRYLASSTGA